MAETDDRLAGARAGGMAVTGAAFAAFPCCLSPLIARAARENREPEDRLSDLPVAGRSVRFPESASGGKGGLGRYQRPVNSAAPAWRARTIAPAKGQAGAAEFDACQIWQETEGDRAGVTGMCRSSSTTGRSPKLQGPVPPDIPQIRNPLSSSKRKSCRRRVLPTDPDV